MFYMLLNKEVEVSWNNANRKHYESKGYVFTECKDRFVCLIEDLPKNSTVKVKFRCDYCGEFEGYKDYRAYLLQRKTIKKDSCTKCKGRKSKEVGKVKFGCENISQTKKYKDDKKKRMMENFDRYVVYFKEEKNIEILTDREYYVNKKKSRIKIICKNHPEVGIQDTTIYNLFKNKKCCFYGGNELIGKAKRKDFGIVYEDFLNRSYIPMFCKEDYISNASKLQYICKKHRSKGVQIIQYSNLTQGKGCLYCGIEKRSEALTLDQDKVFDLFTDRGFEIEPTEKYIGHHEHIKCRCINHPKVIQSINYTTMRMSEQPCYYCRIQESVSNVGKFFRSSLFSWKNKIKKECNRQCVLTKSNKYDIHHIVPYNNIVKNSLEDAVLECKLMCEYSEDEKQIIKDKIINYHVECKGVCLHPELHILFHKIYGKANCNMEDFLEFKKDYKSGKFNK